MRKSEHKQEGTEGQKVTKYIVNRQFSGECPTARTIERIIRNHMK